MIDDIIKFTYNEKRKMVSRNGYKNKLCDHGKYKNEIIKERETRLYIFNDGITDETKIAPDATLTDIANDQNLIAMFPEPRSETNREEQKKYQYAISLAMGESVLLAHAEEKLDDMKDYYKEYYIAFTYFGPTASSWSFLRLLNKEPVPLCYYCKKVQRDGKKQPESDDFGGEKHELGSFTKLGTSVTLGRHLNKRVV